MIDQELSGLNQTMQTYYVLFLVLEVPNNCTNRHRALPSDSQKKYYE